MSSTTYDIAIIGAGAAGLQLALALRSEPFFREKSILLLEKDGKNQNDRTWCFWERGEGKWDALLHKSWNEGDFFAEGKAKSLDMGAYRYKMLKAIDFYSHAKTVIASSPNFTWLQDEVRAVKSGTAFSMVGVNNAYSAQLVFDSRIPASFYEGEKKDSYTRLLQHFKGWVVRTPDDRFDPHRFTMMDFRERWKNTTSFTYILPFNRREALVEFTLFSPELLKPEEYDIPLHNYFDKILKIKDFEILETEYGVIPMTDFPFEKYSVGNHIRIGTAGGWVKPSSGYSFKNCERNASRVVANLIACRPAGQGLISKKFRLFDSLFLDVLNRRNELGHQLFSTMYFKNNVQKILAFLDEETSLADELRIISKFPQLLFLRSLAAKIVR